MTLNSAGKHRRSLRWQRRRRVKPQNAEVVSLLGKILEILTTMRPCRLTSKPSLWAIMPRRRISVVPRIARSFSTQTWCCLNDHFAKALPCPFRLKIHLQLGRLPVFSGRCPDCQRPFPAKLRKSHNSMCTRPTGITSPSKFDIEVWPTVYSRCRVRIASRVRKDVHWLTQSVAQDSGEKNE